MPYNDPTYRGDDEYRINTTGDCVVGDDVRFERAKFSGSFKSPKFAGFEVITGTIVADSYGKAKQQHTFTLLLADGSKMLIKGRNLYANGTWRKPWLDESQREQAADEKHARGASARKAREVRKSGSLNV